jgi:uncharacterized NAD-dependent epimerase/dehydratase family protein
MNLRSEYDPPVPAIILAEGAFGTLGGKTANGVVRHSELFSTRGVIDSTRAGGSAGEVLRNVNSGLPDVPIVGSTAEALDIAPDTEALILGVAPAGGQLPTEWHEPIREAMYAGCDVVSGLHAFLSEQPEWASIVAENGVSVYDIRKPPDESDLRVADGRAADVESDVVLTMGTDCAVGKRTTTFELYRAACKAGLDAGWVATGQTGIMVGAHQGIVIDRVPADFAAGVVEDMVCEVATNHEIVFVEGQASLSHPAYSGVTLSILCGAWPDTVVLADDPDREHCTHFEDVPIPSIQKERRLIEQLSDATVAAVSTWGDSGDVQREYGVPAANVYEEEGPQELLAAVQEAL